MKARGNEDFERKTKNQFLFKKIPSLYFSLCRFALMHLMQLREEWKLCSIFRGQPAESSGCRHTLKKRVKKTKKGIRAGVVVEIFVEHLAIIPCFFGWGAGNRKRALEKRTKEKKLKVKKRGGGKWERNFSKTRISTHTKEKNRNLTFFFSLVLSHETFASGGDFRRCLRELVVGCGSRAGVCVCVFTPPSPPFYFLSFIEFLFLFFFFVLAVHFLLPRSSLHLLHSKEI